jgi:hypothetical protein
VVGLTTEPAWPTLRAHLLALAAETGEHPLRHMMTAATGRDLKTAGDMAAVLDWRLPEPAATDPGPLPWLPGIPETLHAHPVWGAYLAKRSLLVADLANQVQDHTCQRDAQPIWAPPGSHPATALIGEIAVWRAANGIKPKTRDQPGEPNSKRFRPCGNNASTGPSRVRPTRQQMRRPTSDGQDAPHLLAATPTRSTLTNSPNGVRAGRPRRADSTRHSRHIAAPGHEDARHTATAGRSDRSCDPGPAAARRRIRLSN